MKLATISIILFLASSLLSAQSTYQQLSEQALECIDRDSLIQAEAYFREALRLEPANPHNALLFSNMGTIQRRMLRFDDAIESYTYSLNIAPLAIPILLNRATTYMESGMTDKAYIDYCQVLDVDKKNAEALLMRAYIYIGRRDYNAARIDYGRLLEIDPFSYNGRLGLATLNQAEKKYNDAIKLINELLAEYSQDATLYIIRAGIEIDMENLDLALIDLEESIRLSPHAPDGFLLRGEVYLSQKKKMLAKRDFETAISLGIPQTDLREQLQLCK